MDEWNSGRGGEEVCCCLVEEVEVKTGVFVWSKREELQKGERGEVTIEQREGEQ